MSEPDPPRTRSLWWKVALAMLALLLLIAFLGHVVWTIRERANVAQRVAAIRALGEPIDPADLSEPAVPDAHNIAIPFRVAAGAFVEPRSRSHQRDQMERDDPHAFELPLNDDESTLLRASVADNGATFAALDGLPTRTGVAWGTTLPPGTPRFLTLLPELHQARQFAGLLDDAAKLDVVEGRGAATALARLATIDLIAPAINARQSLISTLVAASLESTSACATSAIAPRVSFDLPVDRSAARARIASLLDDASVEQMFRTGLLGERVTVHETMKAMRAGMINATMGGTITTTVTVPQQCVGYVLTPVLYAGDAAALDYFGAVLPLLRAPCFADFDARAAPMRAMWLGARTSKLTMLSSFLVPSLDRSLRRRYTLLTERHLAAVALAIRLYQADHAGALPTSLEALGPDYFPRVPSDAIDGQPLRYDAVRAIVWSVGDNGTDERGDETVKSPNYAGELWMMRDAVVHLTPTTRPTTMASE